MSGVDELLKADAAAVLQLLDQAADPSPYAADAGRAAADAVATYRYLCGERHTPEIALVSCLSGYIYGDQPDAVVAAVTRALFATERADREAWSAHYRRRTAAEAAVPKPEDRT